jgi:hypothetical protein
MRSETVDKPKVLDLQGQERDWEWLESEYGRVTFKLAQAPSPGAPVYRLFRLQDTEGPAAAIVNVVDPNGQPLEGVRVVRYWPDAPELPDWPEPVSKWFERGVHGPTNAEGNLGFGMGKGDYYRPEDGGPCAIWVADGAGPSDLLGNHGMLHGTNHRHLNLFYRLEPGAEAEEPLPAPEEPEPQPAPEEPEDSTPPPAPPPAAPELSEEQWRELFDRLDRLIHALEERLNDS